MLEYFFVYKYNASYLFYYQNKVLLIISTLNLSLTIEEARKPENYILKKFHCKVICNFEPNVSGLRGKYHNLILYQVYPNKQFILTIQGRYVTNSSSGISRP